MAERRDDEVLPHPIDGPVRFATDLREAVKTEAMRMTFTLSRREDYGSHTVIWYEFMMRVGRHKFTIQCKPREPEVGGWCGLRFGRQSLVKCETFKTSKTISDEDQIAPEDYGHKTYNDSMETKTCQLLMQYLIEENYEFRFVSLELPPIMTGLHLRQIPLTEQLRLSVPRSVTDEDFLASWLEVIGVSNVERLVLGSVRIMNNIRSHEAVYNQLKSIDYLEISGRTDLKYEFLLAFTGSTLILNDSQSEITIVQMVDWWTKQRGETTPKPRRIELRKPQDVRMWDTIKGNVYGGFAPKGAPSGRFDQVVKEQRHFFELRRDRLTMLFEPVENIANNQ